jgi:hypothetical protein
MGSITYDFLADSIFFHDHSLRTEFEHESMARLEKELDDYRTFILKNYQTLRKEITDKNSFLKVFSSVQDTSISLLKQTALYVDQFIVYDSLFDFTDRQSDISNLTSKYLGYQQGQIDKTKLKEAASFLKGLTPMVVADYVKVFPLGYHHEPPDVIPFNLTSDHYTNSLPKALMEFFWNNAEVRSMSKLKNQEGWVVENDLKPCRGIIVDFKESQHQFGMLYHLFQTQVKEFNEETGEVTIVHFLPDTPPELDEFHAWVTQSINSASKNYFDRVFRECYLASSLKATYLTDNRFKSRLVSENFEGKETIQTFTANQVMNVDLPFFDELDTDRLMSIRMDDSKVFETFRLELEKHCRELRSISDPKLVEQKMENVFHELNDVQGQKIRQKVDALHTQFKLGAAIGIGGLAGSFQTGGITLLATATAIAKGYKDYVDFKEKVKENPAYFLWKSKRRTK